jgi:hypothetical protein
VRALDRRQMTWGCWNHVFSRWQNIAHRSMFTPEVKCTQLLEKRKLSSSGRFSAYDHWRQGPDPPPRQSVYARIFFRPLPSVGPRSPFTPNGQFLLGHVRPRCPHVTPSCGAFAATFLTIAGNGSSGLIRW